MRPRVDEWNRLLSDVMSLLHTRLTRGREGWRMGVGVGGDDVSYIITIIPTLVYVNQPYYSHFL